MNLHIMKVLEVSHLSENGDLLFNKKNINNILHLQGEEFMLKALFGGQSIPTEYYLGLDARTTLVTTNSISSLSGLEPSSGGYARQNVNANSFSFVTDETGNYQANSPIVLFRSTTATWGPVRNIFLATQAGYNGYLISSIPLGTNLTVQPGEIVSMRIGLALRNN
jgi:hypothetical protein